MHSMMHFSLNYKFHKVKFTLAKYLWLSSTSSAPFLNIPRDCTDIHWVNHKKMHISFTNLDSTETYKAPPHMMNGTMTLFPKMNFALPLKMVRFGQIRRI